ncbi:MAG: archaeal proteasome endopeptidase complex subunit beta [Candidatus Odinarchaeia archaeon]
MVYTTFTGDLTKLSTGTTTVGVKCKDGVILATDTRATAGSLIAHKQAQKIYVLDDHLAATIAGSVADAQKIMDTISAEAKLYKIKTGKSIRVKAAARVLANILFQSRLMPYILQLIIGGYDDTGPRLFILDFFGSLSEEKYTSTGSGSPFALGVLENKYDENLKVDEFIPIAIRAVKSAMERDIASGDGINVVIIKKEGVTKIKENEIKNYLR